MEDDAKEWSRLWKIAVPSKIKIFLWRLAKHSIPTGDVRYRRHMAESPACSLCGREDSWRHSLIECNMARCVWVLSDDMITEHISISTEPTARRWLFSMMESMKQPDLTRMLVTLWAIWHARRKAIHEEVFQSPMATNMFVNRFIDELEGCTVREKPSGEGRPDRVHRTWILPPAGMSKINVDAAVAKTETKGAVGAVCRSAEGLYLGASAVVFDGISHPGVLEALACREALDIVDDLLLQHIRVASDCLEVVKGLSMVNLGRFGSVLAEIKDRARLRGDTTFVHEGRGSNEEAHRIARFASSLPIGRHVLFLEPPVGLNIAVTLGS